MMCGICGSGKTTYAKQKEKEGYVRLSIDEEMWKTYGRKGIDYPNEQYEKLSEIVEMALQKELLSLIQQGKYVVLDFSFWNKENREYYKRLIEKAGGTPELVYMKARNYVDYYFEYNKENELICSQFIDKQIYGNSGLDVFIKKGFKTNEEINVNKTLILAYLALVLSLGITLWQYFNTDNSDIITIQNQLTEIQQTLYDNSPPDITEIENKLQEIYDSSDITSINQQLEEILNEIKEYKQTP